MVYPLYIFELVRHKPELLQYTLDKFEEVVQESIILYIPIKSTVHYTKEQLKLYDKYKERFEKLAIKQFTYPGQLNSAKWGYLPDWRYHGILDERVLTLSPGEPVVFCGGYVENCLPRAFGAFKREYGTFCISNGNDIRIDRSRAMCAQGTGLKEDIFMNTREEDLLSRSMREFEFRERCID